MVRPFSPVQPSIAVILPLCLALNSCKGTTKPEWFSTIDTLRSEMDTSVRYRSELSLAGSAGYEGSQRTEVAMLLFKCADGQLHGQMIMDTHTGSADSVRVRLDSAPPFYIAANVSSWSGGPSGVVRLQDPSSFLSSLRAHGRLLVEYPVPGQGPGMAEFDVSGVEAHLSKLEAGCNDPRRPRQLRLAE